jgi:hypothetical protein
MADLEKIQLEKKKLKIPGFFQVGLFKWPTLRAADRPAGD